jgi:hypothetical protein
MAVGVVDSPLLLVAENLVGLGGLFELLFALRVFAVDVGMQLPRELAVGLLYLWQVGVARHAEHLVVVAFHLCVSQVNVVLVGH